MSEGNYEEAVITFTAAIKIDPKRAEIYIGLADAYVGLNDCDKAIETIQKGLEMCDDEVGISLLSDRLYELKNFGDIARLLCAGDQGNLLTYSEITFLGCNIENLDIDTAKELLYQNEYTVFSDVAGEESRLLEAHGSSFLITCAQRNAEEHIHSWEYRYDNSVNDYKPVEIGIRDISLYDSLETVLAKLGFSTAASVAETIEIERGITYETQEEKEERDMNFFQRSNYYTKPSDDGNVRFNIVFSLNSYYDVSFNVDVSDGNHRYACIFSFKDGDLVSFHVLFY